MSSNNKSLFDSPSMHHTSYPAVCNDISEGGKDFCYQDKEKIEKGACDNNFAQEKMNEIAKAFNVSVMSSSILDDITKSIQNEYIKVTIEDIKRKYGIETESNSLEEVIDSVISYINEEADFAQQRSKSLEDGASEFIGDLEKQLETLKTQINSLTSQLSQTQKDAEKEKHEIESKLSEIRNKNNELTKENNSLQSIISQNIRTQKHLQTAEEGARKELQEIQEKLEIATKTLNEAANENERLANKIKELEDELSVVPPSPSEKLIEMASTVTQQFDLQSTELQDMSKQRFDLISIIQKQSVLLSSLETALQKPPETAENDAVNQTALPSMFSPMKRSVPEIDFNAAIEKANAGEKSLYTKSELLNIVSEEDLNPSEKVTNIISYLANEIETALTTTEEQIKDADRQIIIDRLLENQKRLIRFVEQFANSNVDLSEDLRQDMISACARISTFMQDSASGFIEDAGLLVMTDLGCSPTELTNIVTSFFSKYSDLKTNEGEELFLVARTAIAAASILRRYGEEAQTHIGRVGTENKLLKQQITAASETAERRAQEKIESCQKEIESKETQIKEETAAEVLKSVEAVLRSNITNPEVFKPVSDCLKMIKEGGYGFVLNPSEYNEAITTELEKSKSELEEKSANFENLRKSIEAEASELENTSGLLESEAREQLEAQLEDLERLSHDLNESRLECEATRAEFERLKAQNAALLEKLNETNAELENTKSQMENEKAKMERRFRAKFEKGVRAIHDDCRQKIDRLQKRLVAVQARVQSETEAKQKAIDDGQKKIDELSASHIQLESGLRAEQDELRQEISRMKKQMKESDAAMKEAQLESKLVKMQLKASEDKAKREREQLEASLKLKQMQSDSAAAARALEAAGDSERRHREFLNEVCSTFRDYVDCSLPVTDQSILQFLNDVYARLRIADRDSDRVEDAEKQMHEIRELLHAPKGTRTTAVVRDFVEEFENLKEKVEKLRQKPILTVKPPEVPEKAWEDWALKVAQSTPAGPAAGKDIKKAQCAIEEAVFAAAADPSMQRKIETLKAEKCLLSQSFNVPNPDSRPVTFTAVICGLMFLRRVARIARALPSELSFKREFGDFEEVSEKVNDNGDFPGEAEMIPLIPRKSISEVFAKSVLL